ncbi:MAG: 2-amino-4-hydroxy-6-hydroxymethyldihydropteridine diphosphokinase [Sulfuriferula sp.]
MNNFTQLPAKAFIALGSNLVNPAGQVLQAFAAIAALPQTELCSRSSLYLSTPIGYADQPDFINAVVQIKTTLSAHQLLAALLDIEQCYGRERTFRNAPRVIDLDILLYDQLIQCDTGLSLPHPRMHERAFVLIPLLEIAPEVIIPGLGPAAACLPAAAGQNLQHVDDDWRCHP